MAADNSRPNEEGGFWQWVKLPGGDWMCQRDVDSKEEADSYLALQGQVLSLKIVNKDGREKIRQSNGSYSTYFSTDGFLRVITCPMMREG